MNMNGILQLRFWDNVKFLPRIKRDGPEDLDVNSITFTGRGSQNNIQNGVAKQLEKYLLEKCQVGAVYPDGRGGLLEVRKRMLENGVFLSVQGRFEIMVSKKPSPYTIDSRTVTITAERGSLSSVGREWHIKFAKKVLGFDIPKDLWESYKEKVRQCEEKD